MARRKSRAKPAPKKRMDKLNTEFTCPFCNYGASVTCTFNKKTGVGSAACTVCKEDFTTFITSLTEPIDIYSEWLDECERVNSVRGLRLIQEDDDA